MFELAKCAKVDSSPELGTLQIQEPITYGLLIFLRDNLASCVHLSEFSSTN